MQLTKSEAPYLIQEEFACSEARQQTIKRGLLVGLSTVNNINTMYASARGADLLKAEMAEFRGRSQASDARRQTRSPNS